MCTWKRVYKAVATRPHKYMHASRLVPAVSYAGCSLLPLRLAEPRIILENSNPFTIDGVNMFGGTAGDCIIQFPQVSRAMIMRDHDAYVVMTSPTRLACGLSFYLCFVGADIALNGHPPMLVVGRESQSCSICSLPTVRCWVLFFCENGKEQAVCTSTKTDKMWEYLTLGALQTA